MLSPMTFAEVLARLELCPTAFLVVDREREEIHLGLDCALTNLPDAKDLLDGYTPGDGFTLIPYQFSAAPALHFAPQFKAVYSLLPLGDTKACDKGNKSPCCEAPNFEPLSDDKTYGAQYAAARAALIRGDVFQLVLSNRFEARGLTNATELLSALYAAEDSPFLVYAKTPERSWISATPEILVEKRGNQLVTVPIAGTCQRLKDGQDDLRAKALLEDPKERAEHLMLVDLSRNDLGRVSMVGSVQVSRYAEVKIAQRAQHLVSTIEGTLAPQCHPLAPLLATLPAGTVTGAPKTMAMALIDVIEPQRRTYYGGAFLLDLTQGDYRAYLHIRSLELDAVAGCMRYQVGSGIVIDSTLEGEAQELRTKAAGMMETLGGCYAADTR